MYFEKNNNSSLHSLPLVTYAPIVYIGCFSYDIYRKMEGCCWVIRKIVNKWLQIEGKYEGCSSKVERVGKDGYLQMQTNEPSFKAMK